MKLAAYRRLKSHLNKSFLIELHEYEIKGSVEKRELMREGCQISNIGDTVYSCVTISFADEPYAGGRTAGIETDAVILVGVGRVAEKDSIIISALLIKTDSN